MKTKYKVKRIYTKFGSYLADSREKAGLTQRAVATKLGYSSAQFISNFERGIALPPLKKMAVIKEMYNLRTKDVVVGMLEAERERLEIGLGVRK